jgi:hypothetical protein
MARKILGAKPGDKEFPFIYFLHFPNFPWTTPQHGPMFFVGVKSCVEKQAMPTGDQQI